MKGKSHSAETKEKASIRSSGKRNPFYGKKHTQDVKSRISKHPNVKSMKGKKRPEHSKKMKEVITSYWKGLTEEERASRLAKHDFSALQKACLCNGGRYSKLHKSVILMMNEVGIDRFESEKQIGRYVYDEVREDKKVIIEVNGDFWHANPNIYAEEDVVRLPKGDKIAREIWNSDKLRVSYAQELGYKVFIIWESDVKSGKVFDKLKGINEKIRKL
jgi:G:T-mismatch repair DNA endonuclease (very short patch repair protein)